MDLRLEIVTRDGGSSTPVVVTAAPGDTVADLVPLLATHLGRVVDGLTAGDRALAPDSPLGAPPVLDGAVLTVGSGRRATVAPDRPGILHLEAVGGPDAGASVPLVVGEVPVGRDVVRGLRLADPGVSRRHLTVRLATAGIEVEEATATNGLRSVAPDGSLTTPAASLSPGTLIRVGGSTLAVRTRASRPAVTDAPGDGTLRVQRQPRVHSGWRPVTLDRPAPPDEPPAASFPWVSVLLPLPVAAVLAFLWGPQLLAFALLGPLMAGGSAISDRLGGRRTARGRAVAYAEVVAVFEAETATNLAAERRHLLTLAPDAAQVLQIAESVSTRLWERGAPDTDGLAVRLGLGDVPAGTSARRPGGGSDPLTLPQAPVVVDLRTARSLGLRTASADLTHRLARSLLCQLAVLTSPAVVSIARVGDDPAWAWLDRLPHAPGEGGGPEHLERLRAVARAATGRADTGRPATAHVLLVPHADLVASTPGLADLVADGPDHGIHCIVLDDAGTGLPAEVHTTVDQGPEPTTLLLRVAAAPEAAFLVDGVSSAYAARVARALTPLRVATSAAAGDLPDRVDLLALHGTPSAEDVLARWAGRRGPLSRLGVDAAGPFTVDLCADGPHALVGGTTGSGKSELLRALVGGLALASSPEDLSLVLVDYKGGAAFGDLVDLPHVASVVTDLDGELVERAIVGLEAEIRRREHALATTGAKDLEDHLRRAPGTHLPRLVIVVDELRALVDELPDFVPGLVRIAALGRSLGVHLVLATQRPAGVVTSDIAANMNLRIALRVRDRADSEAIIEVADAAALPAGTPGRAIASAAGDRSLFQAALVGGGPVVPTPPLTIASAAGTTCGPARPAPAPVADEGIVRLLQRAAATAGHRRPAPPWAPPLPMRLAAADLPTGTPTPGFVLGLVDRPAEQRVDPFVWDPRTGGHLAVVGGPSSGRTTALRTVIAAALSAPAAWHVQILEAGRSLAPLADLPDVGSVVSLHAPDLVDRLLRRLEEEIRSRRAGGADTTAARLLLAVDGLDSLGGGGVVDLAAQEAVDRLLRALRDGPAVGVHCVATGQRSLVAGRVASAFDTVLALDGLGASDTLLLGLGHSSNDRVAHPGRGRLVPSGDRFQFAHVGIESDVDGQESGLRAIPSRADTSVGAPFVVRDLPARVGLSDLPPDGLTLGLDEDHLPLGFEEGDGPIIVAGPRRSGRSTALRLLARRLALSGRSVVLVAAEESRADGGTWRTVPPTAADELGRLVDADPATAVLVDDLDRLVGTATEALVHDLVTRSGRRPGLLAASATGSSLTATFRGPVFALAQHRTGILLGPSSRAEGDVLGISVRSSTDRTPGRGLLVRDGVPRLVQLADLPAQVASERVAIAAPIDARAAKASGIATLGRPA